MIPYGRPLLDEEDIAAVVEVLRGPMLTQGPVVERFERAVAERVRAEHAVAFSSGTAGLHAAAAAARLGPEDLVAVPSLTFAASANLAYYVGADLTFVDVDPGTLCSDPAAIPTAATATVIVHFAGLPVDLGRFRHRPRIVIEDAAHALGAIGPDGPIGNCARSDLCVFSFHPVKTVTSGEGGIVTTNDDQLAERLRRFRNHGIDRVDPDEPWSYRIEEEGFNYRLSDIHAALGYSQMSKVDRYVERRNELADRYDLLLSDCNVTAPPRAPSEPPGQVHARHIYPILVKDRRELYAALRSRGIGVQVHYVPLHHQPRFANGQELPFTDQVGERVLTLPLHPLLTDAEQDAVIEVVKAEVSHSSGDGATDGVETDN